MSVVNSLTASDNGTLNKNGSTAAHAAQESSPPEDINADRGYREHLARVLVARALEESLSSA